MKAMYPLLDRDAVWENVQRPATLLGCRRRRAAGGNPPPPNWRQNSADFADLFCRFVGFLNFAHFFC